MTPPTAWQALHLGKALIQGVKQVNVDLTKRVAGAELVDLVMNLVKDPGLVICIKVRSTCENSVLWQRKLAVGAAYSGRYSCAQSRSWTTGGGTGCDSVVHMVAATPTLLTRSPLAVCSPPQPLQTEPLHRRLCHMEYPSHSPSVWE